MKLPVWSLQSKLKSFGLWVRQSAERWIKIHSTEEGFEVYDPLNPGDLEPTEIRRYIGEKPGQQKGNGQKIQSSQSYSVSVSGAISFSTGPPEFADRGVYGNGVVLWFRDSGNPGTWYHPLTGNIQGIHYDLLDEQGNFSFSFNFTGDLSEYDELTVLVNTVNDVAIMPTSQDGYISFGNGFTAYLNESEGLLVYLNLLFVYYNAIQSAGNMKLLSRSCCIGTICYIIYQISGCMQRSEIITI